MSEVKNEVAGAPREEAAAGAGVAEGVAKPAASAAKAGAAGRDGKQESGSEFAGVGAASSAAKATGCSPLPGSKPAGAHSLSESASNKTAVYKPKKGGKAAQRARAMCIHRIVRWCVQIAFFVLAPSIFSATFNGVKYLATQVGASQAAEPTSFVVLLVAMLAFTILFGRFFCGYACAFGTLGDAVYLLFAPVRKLLNVPDRPLSGKVQRAGQYVKFGVLAAIALMCFFGVWSEISGYSPWTAFAGIVGGSFEGISAAAFVVLGALMLGMALVKRFFCQFLCPLGALFALMPVMSFSAFSRKKGCCAKSCGKCCASCPVSVYPDADSFAAGECIACGKCADVCPIANASLLRAEATGEERAGKPPKRILRGNEICLVLLKAALLVAVLWLAGALSGVPAFTEVTGMALPWG
jgi:ferredoxin-type protein NapH